MTGVLEAVFWLSALLIIYTYAGYPLLMALLSTLFKKPVSKSQFATSVAIVLTVHNEEKSLKAKLENLLALDHPDGELEILVVSDASTDATDQIVESFDDRRIRLLRIEPRRGKHYAQKRGIEATSGDIIAFTDVAPVLETDSLREMVNNFSDPEVGCVSSLDQVAGQQDELSREGDYIDYDMTLRLWESHVGSVTGLSGSFFAARRELCQSWWLDRSSDFFLPLESVRRGYRAILDPASVHYYSATQGLGFEYHRKSRTVLNGLVVFFDSLDLLNPARFGFYPIQLLSHKLFRWLIPFALVAILLSSALLAAGSWLFGAALAAQITFYMLAFLGCLFLRFLHFPLIRSAAFFTVSNAAILVAWKDLLSGRTRAIWEPTRRP